MKKFIVISRDFSENKFIMKIIQASHIDEAWERTEEENGNAEIQSWLMTPEQFKRLKTEINKNNDWDE